MTMTDTPTARTTDPTTGPRTGAPTPSGGVSVPDLLAGRRIALRPVTPDDYQWLYLGEVSGELGSHWRIRGGTPSPEDYVQLVWQGVLAQFLVVRHDEPERPLGLVVAYDAHHSNGYASVAVVRFDREPGDLSVLEATILFFDYLFTSFAFRKLYLETPAYRVDQFGSAVGDLIIEEGRLVDHSFHDGRYWDEHLLAVHREVWDEKKPDLLRFVR